MYFKCVDSTLYIVLYHKHVSICSEDMYWKECAYVFFAFLFMWASERERELTVSEVMEWLRFDWGGVTPRAAEAFGSAIGKGYRVKEEESHSLTHTQTDTHSANDI